MMSPRKLLRCEAFGGVEERARVLAAVSGQG